MKTITADTILSWSPCWENAEERVRRLVTEPVSALDILTRRDGEWSNISDQDRLWAVLREDLIDARTLRLFACDCAERALQRERDAGREPDQRSWEAVRVSRRFAVGEATATELAAAGDAARVAALAAARYAALAARAAAWYAAWADAREAAREAALAAARVAELAAGDAECRWQVEHLAGMLAAIERQKESKQ